MTGATASVAPVTCCATLAGYLVYLLVTPEALKNGPLPPKAESADKLTVFQTDDKVAKCKNKQTIF